MKRAKARKRAKPKPAGKAKKEALKPEYSLDVPVDIPDVREKITRLVGNEALKMVRSMVSKVREGHYLGMKYLFEMIGLFPAPGSVGAESEESLTKTLLRNLGLEEENSAQDLGLQTKVTKEKCSPADEAIAHAVK